MAIFKSGKKFPLQKGCTCESYKAAKQACFIVKHVVGNSILQEQVFFEYINIWNYAFCRGPWVLNIKKRVVAHDILQDIEVLMNNFPGDTILQYQGIVMQTGVRKWSLQQKPVSILWIGMNFIHKTNMSFLLALFCFFVPLSCKPKQHFLVNCLAIALKNQVAFCSAFQGHFGWNAVFFLMQ